MSYQRTRSLAPMKISQLISRQKPSAALVAGGILAFMIVLWPFQSPAQTATERPPVSEVEIQKRLAEAKTRLNLSDEQVTKLKPLILEELQKLRALRDAHAGDTSVRARRAKLRDAKAIQRHFDENLEKILTKDQLKEWKKLRSERREKLKEEMKRRRVEV